jgi:hypothetical protein
MDTIGIDAVRQSLANPEIYGLYQLVWDKANSQIPAGNSSDADRLTRSQIAKEAAFVVLMDRKPENGSIVSLSLSEKQQLIARSTGLLEEINTAVGFQSGFVFYQEWQSRSKELINYLVAYDLLKAVSEATGGLGNAKDSLIAFTAHLYHRAMDTYTVFIWQFKFFEYQFNNHSIMTASALGLSAIIFNDNESPDPDYQPQNWINAGLWNLDNTLWVENGIYPRVSEPDTIAGYAEGPGYFDYGFENAFAFLRAFYNFLPDGYYPVTFNSITRDIRNPWYDPSYDSLYEWIHRIRLPDGSLPAIHDSPVFFGTSIIALSGKSRYNIPNPSYPPDDPMFRTQYIATLVSQGTYDIPPFQPLPLAGSLVFRSSWEPDAIYLHFIGKHGIPLSGAKAHHQGDASGFSLMANGELLAIDPGYPGAGEVSAVNKPTDHNLILVNGSGPLPPIGEAVSVETNTAWIENFFNTPLLDYGEVHASYFGVEVARKALFVNDNFFILGDFLTSANQNTYTFQFHGNGLYGGDPHGPEGSFLPDFGNQQGIYERDSTSLLVHVTATGGAPAYSFATDSLATGTSQYRDYSKMLVERQGIASAGFLSVFYPYEISVPEVIYVNTSPEISAVYIGSAPFEGLAFIRNEPEMTTIPASTSGIPVDITGNGTFTFAGFSNGLFLSLFLGNGDSLWFDTQIYIAADSRKTIAYEKTGEEEYGGYVSDSGWVSFFTEVELVPQSGNILACYNDLTANLVHVHFGGTTVFSLVVAEGVSDSVTVSSDPMFSVRPALQPGMYMLETDCRETSTAGIVVMSVTGQRILSERIRLVQGKNQHLLDIRDKSPGCYLVDITCMKKRQVVKIIHP